MATVVCLHCIYGKKVKFDVGTVGMFLGVLMILEISNTFQLGGILSLSVYLILYVYCSCVFKSAVKETIISVLIYIIILTVIQFVCICFVDIVVSDNQLLRNVISNLLALVICYTILPKCRLHSLQECMCKKGKYVILLLGFIFIVIMFMLLQEKLVYKIRVHFFLLVVPAIILLLFLFIKWYVAQTQADKMKETICKVEKNAKEQEVLLTKVRLRQHEFKNHMAAIFSAHYTNSTYERLVQAQEQYCNKLMDENRYNDLLLLGNNILVGYLYEKFLEANQDGIEIKYKVATMIDKMQVPTYFVVEMLGILLDNAMEAQEDVLEKVISFEAYEHEESYEFVIRNPFRYVSYSEIEEWFQMGISEKGSERGFGLYHLRCLGNELKCDIGCRNVEQDQRNWIEFALGIRKADNK